MSRNESSSAHNHAVQAISDARQHVRKYHFNLERANVPDDQVFVASDHPDHPQKNAHAALMDYYAEINQVEYIVMFDDIWKEEFTDAAGNTLEVTVPKNETVEKHVNERTGVENMTPDLDLIETTTEALSLERLSHKWAGRNITVEATVDSPYRDEQSRVEAVRMWLPPLLRTIKSSR